MTAYQETRASLGRGDIAILSSLIILVQSWVLGLPFQLDDFTLVANPSALFNHVPGLVNDDVPAFMCRIPMWCAWWVVHLLSPRPLSPIPFHILGLALHVVTALLLARVVMRHAPQEWSRAAGRLAGLAFGTLGGAMQAVSWTAAWSSLIYTLFALGALNLALDGRDRAIPWRRLRAPAAGLLFYLAIITKVPGLVAVVVALVLLAMIAFASEEDTRAGRLLVEWACGGVAVVAGLLTRSWFLGTSHLRYEERIEPGLTELPNMIARGFQALGQALFPWNRDQLFLGEEPLLAHLGLSAPLLALAVVGTCVLLALALAPEARPLLLGLALCLVPAVLPAGAIYLGQGTNVVSREAYLPLALAAALIGVAVGAVWYRHGLIALALMAGMAFFVMDGTRHLAITERLHAVELRATTTLLDQLADEFETLSATDAPLVLALVPDAGFGGIPSLGLHLPLSHAPPFTHRRRLDIRPFKNTADMGEWLASTEALATRSVILIGPACDPTLRPLPADPMRSGAVNRGRRLLRRLTPLRAGIAVDDPRELILAGSSRQWKPRSPLPAHSVGALELELPGASPLSGDLVVQTPGRSWPIPIQDAGQPGTRLTLGMPSDPAFRLGPGIVSVAWIGEQPPPVATILARAALPLLAPLVPGPGANLAASGYLGRGPTFAVEAPELGLRRGTSALLEMRFDLLGRRATFFSDMPVDPFASTRLEFSPSTINRVQVDHLRENIDAPWRDLLDLQVMPRLTGDSLQGATFEWRILLFHSGGSLAALSPFSKARFVLR